MRFLDRDEELSLLEDRWSRGSSELLVVWGRRRCGKTELLLQFAQGRRGVFFEATAGTEADQLRDFAAALAEAADSDLLRTQPLTSWEAALAGLAGFADRRCVVVLDEFQYLAAAQPGLPSLLARWWRQTGRDLPLMLVLSGSEISFFERDVLGSGSPLFGRRTAQLQVMPFGYREAGLFLEDWDPVDRIRAHAVWGGMPYYLSQLDPEQSLAANILRTTLARDGILREEARLLLFQELPDPRLHFSVLRAIAGGDTRVSQIANRTGLESSAVSRVLESLASLLLVARVVPVTATIRARTRQTAWHILDPYLRFWFRFVFPFEEQLQHRDGQERHLTAVVLPALDAFVARPAFEQVAQAYVRERLSVVNVGSWWGKVPTGVGRATETRDIDVVGTTVEGGVRVLGSCKWTNAPLDVGEEALLTRLEPLVGPPADDRGPRHVFFSRSGFGDGLRHLAEGDPWKYLLVELPELYL